MESLQNVQFKLTILDDHFLMICSERTALSSVHEKRRIKKKLLKNYFLAVALSGDALDGVGRKC